LRFAAHQLERRRTDPGEATMSTTALRNSASAVDQSSSVAALIAEIERHGYRARSAIEACAEHREEATPIFRAALAHAARGSASNERANLAFVGLHFLAAWREESCWAEFLRLAQLPEDDLDFVLGDALTQAFGRMAVGLFNGDAQSVFDAIASPEVCVWVRAQLFGALAFLNWTERIDRVQTINFLERFDRERSAGDDSHLWSCWAECACLIAAPGFDRRIDAARRDGRIDEFNDWPKGFAGYLLEAETDWANGRRFRDARLGYIDDPVAELARWDPPQPEEVSIEEWLAARVWLNQHTPARDRYRDVGRNDPCPCGSGRKAKKCCFGASS
jgi:hypothetical protein